MPLPRGPRSIAGDVPLQLVAVSLPDWSSVEGTLTCHDRVGRGWSGPLRDGVAVSIGRAGSGWGLGLHPSAGAGPVKREGDGRSPAGVFAIGFAFGADEELDTGLEYRPMTPHHWCIDAAGSPDYNRIVDDRDVGHAATRGTEPMRRDLEPDGDACYAVGFVICHNPERTPGAGSCIFAHPWLAPAAATAGCTAMAEQDLRTILAWLRADADPRFVLLPAAERRRRWRNWDLPPPEDAA